MTDTPKHEALASLVERLRSNKHLTQFDGLAALLDTGAEAATSLGALAAENGALLSALQRYGKHDRDCLSRKGAHYGPEHCDCGFREVRG